MGAPLEGDARMIRVKFPRMKIEHGRSALTLGPSEVRAGEGVGIDAEVRASRDRHHLAEDRSHRDRELVDRTGRCLDDVWVRIKAWDAIAPVPDRDHARVIAE